jgi:hypothetical protein
MQPMRTTGWAWLFIIPFAALLFPGLYAHYQPTWAGFPYFYWYMLLWVVLTGILSGIVFALKNRGQ